MSTCPRCGANFGCGMVDGKPDEPCWCTREPLLPPSAYRKDNAGADGSRCF